MHLKLQLDKMAHNIYAKEFETIFGLSLNDRFKQHKNTIAFKCFSCE